MEIKNERTTFYIVNPAHVGLIAKLIVDFIK